MKEKLGKSLISNISIIIFSSFIMILKDLLFISGQNKILIINVNYYELIREIEAHNSSQIYGACILNKNFYLQEIMKE